MSMISRHTVRIFVGWLAIFCFVVPLPSCSLQQTKNRRTAKKPHDRFVNWTCGERDSTVDPLLLVIDGNNVRGIGKFEWNAVELQNRVVKFCHKYKVPIAMVVWDHGSHPFACSRKYWLNEAGNEVSKPLANNDENMFCINLILLFSGIRQRADDVIVKESNHLMASSFQTDSNNPRKPSLAFVTNDSELNHKLRLQSVPIATSIRLSRRKRRDIGKTCEPNEGSNSCSNNDDDNKTKDTPKPMFCDSTGFLDLLSRLSKDYDVSDMNDIDKEASDLINQARESTSHCAKAHRRGYNSRREQTWERCVQAETYRRFLDQRLHSEYLTQSGFSDSVANDDNTAFITKYLRDIQTSRGYLGPQLLASGERSKDSAEAPNKNLPFLGPSRLDKKQRRLLDRYNSLVKKGEIP